MTAQTFSLYVYLQGGGELRHSAIDKFTKVATTTREGNVYFIKFQVIDFVQCFYAWNNSALDEID